MRLETSRTFALSIALLSLAGMGGCATDEWATRQYGDPPPAAAEVPATPRTNSEYGAPYAAQPAPPSSAAPAYGASYGEQSANPTQPQYGATYGGTPKRSGSSGVPAGYVPSVGPSGNGSTAAAQQATPQSATPAPQQREDNFIIESE